MAWNKIRKVGFQLDSFMQRDFGSSFYKRNGCRNFLLLWLLFNLFSTVGCGKLDLKFNGPLEIRETLDGSSLVIHDSKNYRILVTDQKFRLRKEIRHPYLAQRDYSGWGLCVTSENEIVLPNTRRKDPSVSEEELKAENLIREILFFDFEGNLKKRIAWETATDANVFPGGLVFLSSGTLLVSDIRKNNLLEVDKTGKILTSFGEFGSKPGLFYYPAPVLELLSGDLLVADQYNSRLQLFRKDHQFLRVVAEKGTGPGRVMFPTNLCLDPDGNVYCSELEAMRISIFDPDLRFIKNITPQPPKGAEGEDTFFQLQGLVFSKKSRQLLVADTFNSCIHIFDEHGKWLSSVDGVTP